MTDADHLPSPLLLFDETDITALAAPLSAADEVNGLGTDIDATLGWVVALGAVRPRTTPQEWELLASVAARDVAAARVLEPHLDALSILDEALAAGIDVDRDAIGAGPRSSWGVFAAESGGVRLDATPGRGGWVLEGTKPWCSLAADLSHALVTAWVSADERRLFAVDLRHPGVSAHAGPWHARGLERIVSAPVDFRGVPAVPVGEAGWYLRRPGFARGGIGVAACWWGGAYPLRAALRRAARGERADQLASTHLGRADIALWASRTALTHAAREIDGAERASATALATRTRAVIADAVETVLTTAAHALGPLPLVADAAHARRVADLQVYVRQHHAERDLAGLGSAVAASVTTW